MKLTAKALGFSLLGLAYAISAGVVWRRDAEAARPGQVTIRIAQWQLESGVREAVDAIIRRYEQIHPNVHVIQIAVPGGPIYVSWVLTQMAGGNAPDLVEYSYGNPDVGRYFQPLDAEVMRPNPYNQGTPLQGVPWRDTIVDDMVGLDEFNPKLHGYYGIPLNTNASRIVYNLPLLKRITGSDAPPQTYRDLLAMTEKIRAYAAGHNRHLVPIANSRDTYPYLSWMIAMCMTNRYSETLDYQHRMKIEPQELGQSYVRGDWSYDSPPVVAILQELREFGLMCTPGFWERERDTAVTDFVTGNSVMIVAPSWEATNLLALCRFQIGAFQYPYPRENDPVYGKYSRGPFSDGQLQAGMPIYLNRTTRHRAEAIDFLHFMSSVEGSTLFTNVSNWPPATVGVKPSAFASNFAFNPYGYSSYDNFLLPSTDLDSQWYIQTHYSSLWSPGGSVDQFRQVLRDGMGDAIRSDLRLDVISGLDNLRREDTAAAGKAELARGGPPLEELPLVAVPLETRIYQTRAVLGTDLRVPGAIAQEPGEPVLQRGIAEPGEPRHSGATAGAPSLPASGATAGAPSLPASGATAGAPSLPASAATASHSLDAGWQALADDHADKALVFFTARLAADPGSAGARFGQAVSLLDTQPVSPGQIEEARRIFRELAASANGDLAEGSRFFLGRIAQHHQAEPDPAAAAAEYGRLLAEHPSSLWAQTALAPLAELEIYDAGSSLSPAQRIARAGNLLSFAVTPAAICDVQTVLANAIFFYRLPAAGALPHLLAAERTGRLDRSSRTEVLVQIAELSRLAGDTSQAIAYYRTFLRENPIDFRCFMIEKQLAAMASS